MVLGEAAPIEVALMNPAVRRAGAEDWTRRQFVRGLGLGMLGLGLPDVLRLQAQVRTGRRLGRAKSCIMIFLFRGPGAADVPGVGQCPARSGEVTGYINPGQFSGLLGPSFEPVMVHGTLEKPFDLAVPQLTVPAEVDTRRLHGRRDLVGRLDSW